MIRKLFINAEIYTSKDIGRPAGGKAQGELNYFHDGAMAVENGMIKAVGNKDDVLACIDDTWFSRDSNIRMEIDCHGHCLIPGLIDPHTHMCFAETREHEFEMRIQGIPYLEILENGGGILSSVMALSRAGEDELYKSTRDRVLSALKSGTTCLEIKSGYGLDTENELKMLRVIDRIDKTTPVDVVATFLGAHAIPPSYSGNSTAFIDLVVEEMLPAVKKQGVADFCDIFCERGVFTINQSRKLLKAAQKLGLGVKIHADEVHDTGGAGLAADLSAVSADHLLFANDDNIKKMADAGVVATLLPATAYSLRKPYANARKMIERNLPVALATDCNPGSSYTESMPFVIGLAVLNMNMTPAEALSAATLNSAYAIHMASKAGSLEPGKQADFLILEGKTPAILAYHAGISPVKDVYKLGEKII